MKRKVVIVQEYVSAYRLPFYVKLQDELRQHGVRLVVAAGVPGKSQASRGDAITGAIPFLATPQFMTFSIRGKTLTFMRLARVVEDADLVIAQQELRHLETHALLARQFRGGPPVILWGHGRDYAHSRGVFARLLFEHMTRRAPWFFAYTEGGANAVARLGIPRSRIVIVQNSTDTSRLSAARASVTSGELSFMRQSLGIPIDGRVCLFIGALDRTKRLNFLLNACDSVAAEIPDFTLLIAGDGPERTWLTSAVESRPWARTIGRVTGREMALVGAISELLLCPGRVGLVAVDSFALRTPLVTTAWDMHAPEFEYLDPSNSLTTENSIGRYAQGVSDLLRDRDRMVSLSSGCRESATRFTLEAMVTNFATGVLAALNDDSPLQS